MQKNKLIVPFFAALLLLAIFWGCSKKSSSSSSSGDATVNLITSASWKYDTSGIDIDQNGTVDIGDTVLKPCFKDDIFTFHKDSTGVLDEGPTKCNSVDPQTAPLFWFLTNSDKVFNVTSNTALNGTLNIFSINSSKMVLYKDTTVTGFSFRYLISLKH